MKRLLVIFKVKISRSISTLVAERKTRMHAFLLILSQLVSPSHPRNSLVITALDGSASLTVDETTASATAITTRNVQLSIFTRTSLEGGTIVPGIIKVEWLPGNNGHNGDGWYLHDTIYKVQMKSPTLLTGYTGDMQRLKDGRPSPNQAAAELSITRKGNSQEMFLGGGFGTESWVMFLDGSSKV